LSNTRVISRRARDNEKRCAQFLRKSNMVKEKLQKSAKIIWTAGIFFLKLDCETNNDVEKSFFF
jgi:hypothetical protein